jgi:hypothetical protein
MKRNVPALGKPEGKRGLGGRRHIRRNVIKMDLKGIR